MAIRIRFIARRRRAASITGTTTSKSTAIATGTRLFALKRRADRNLGSRRAFLSSKVVSAVSFHRKRTAENYRRGYSLRSATLGSTAAALRAGKVQGKTAAQLNGSGGATRMLRAAG